MESPLLEIEVKPPIYCFLSLLYKNRLVPSGNQNLSYNKFMERAFGDDISIVQSLSPFVSTVQLPALVISQLTGIG